MFIYTVNTNIRDFVSFCLVASTIHRYHSFLFHFIWHALVYHYQFKKVRCMKLEMVYAMLIIVKMPTSRCGHLRYVNEQITPNFWLCINNMYHVTHEWRIDFIQKRIIVFHKAQNSVTSIIIFDFVFSISLIFKI